MPSTTQKPTDPRVALVTGSAQRIGAAIVRHLHQAGFIVFIHYHTKQTAALQLAAELNAQRANSAFTLQQDLEAHGAELALLQQLQTYTNRLDVLVNNASVFKRSCLREGSLSHFDSLFTLHVKVPYGLSLAASPLLAENQGVIINITDTHAQRPLKDYGLYCQSKAALEMQTKVLAKELAPQIRVNAVAPGAILWPVGENALDDESKQRILDKTPLQCAGDPNYIAQAVLSLVENPFITGQILAVNGGRNL